MTSKAGVATRFKALQTAQASTVALTQGGELESEEEGDHESSSEDDNLSDRSNG